MHNTIRQTVPYIDNSVSKKKNLRRINILYEFFCNFKSLPQVVSMVDVVKFGTATMSYLSYNIL